MTSQRSPNLCRLFKACVLVQMFALATLETTSDVIVLFERTLFDSNLFVCDLFVSSVVPLRELNFMLTLTDVICRACKRHLSFNLICKALYIVAPSCVHLWFGD